MSSLDQNKYYKHNDINLENIFNSKHSQFKSKILIQRKDTSNLEIIYDQIFMIYNNLLAQRLKRTSMIDTGVTNKNSNNKMIILIDRQNADNDTLYFSIFNDKYDADELFGNYLLSFSFFINYKTNIVKCYLWWSIYEKIRFFGEM
eukprot:120159_1